MNVGDVGLAKPGLVLVGLPIFENFIESLDNLIFNLSFTIGYWRSFPRFVKSKAIFLVSPDVAFVVVVTVVVVFVVPTIFAHVNTSSASPLSSGDSKPGTRDGQLKNGL